MSREPFEGSGWGERPSPERSPRARRRLPAALAVLPIGAALAVGFGYDAEQARTIEGGTLGDAVDQYRQAHRKGVRKALRAPVVLGVKRKKLESIADCESHGDPRATSSDGTYRGKYQFDRGTWKSNGGSGDPAKAPELEQDLRAAALYRAAGSGPWPNCG